ncbi:MAG: metallophosphoesterase family protein [Chloroflexi bacterium]|jgi:putative phosphoesterase|nr:metallophosphoesterase family protein [Chloroflexota bacterium]
MRVRIAVLADIHGNLPAFEAVLADIRRHAPDQVIVAGDVINRGPQSQECLQAVRATGWPVVFGNHEELVLKLAGGKLPEWWESDWWLPTRRVVESLTGEELDYLRALPWHHVVRVPGLPAIRIVHGSPRALNDGLGFWMTDEELLDAIGGAEEPIVIGAHTHRPFDRQLNGHWALNPGAVGAPFNGNPAAQYLLLTGEDGAWQPEFRAVPYDRAPVYDAWERTGYLNASMVAQVFKYEVETATFHLMSYVDFCEARGLAENALESFSRYRAATQDVVPGRSLKFKPDH